MTVYAFAPGGSFFWLGVPLMALASLATPPLQAMMTRQVSPSEQGQLQGTNNSARSLAGIIGPGIFAGSFAALMDPLPGAPFLAAAVLMLIGIGVGLLIKETSPTEEKA
jgi:DHA1 family tetracycline resistance protein-like MFS transporter